VCTLDVFDTSYNALLIAMAMSDKGVDGKIEEWSGLLPAGQETFC